MDTSVETHMYPVEECPSQPGISAVLAAGTRQTELDGPVLDLAAVLDGLVYENFEIIVVEVSPPAGTSEAVATLRARCPGLPLRMLDQRFVDRAGALTAGFDAAKYDLIFAGAADGQFDVRELNHLFEAIEHGADLAIGYRRSGVDGVLQRVQGWGRNMLVNVVLGKTAREVDCAFTLFRREVWQQVHVQPRWPGRTFCARLLVEARRLGFQVAEVAVSRHRPRLGGDVASPAAHRAA